MEIWVVIYEPEGKPMGAYLTEKEANQACEGCGYTVYHSTKLYTDKKIKVE